MRIMTAHRILIGTAIVFFVIYAAWEASGLSQSDLMDKLIAHAFARHERRRALSLA